MNVYVDQEAINYFKSIFPGKRVTFLTTFFTYKMGKKEYISNAGMNDFQCSCRYQFDS